MKIKTVCFLGLVLCLTSWAEHLIIPPRPVVDIVKNIKEVEQSYVNLGGIRHQTREEAQKKLDGLIKKDKNNLYYFLNAISKKELNREGSSERYRRVRILLDGVFKPIDFLSTPPVVREQAMKHFTKN